MTNFLLQKNKKPETKKSELIESMKSNIEILTQP